MNKKIHSSIILIACVILLFACSKNNPTSHDNTPKTAVFQDGAYPNSSYAGTRDVTLLASADQNWGNCFDADSGYFSNVPARTCIKFDVSFIPAGSTVDSAYLTLYNAYNSTGVNELAAYRLTTAFEEGDLGCLIRTDAPGADYTYAGYGVSWTAAGGDYEIAAISNLVTVTAASLSQYDEVTFTLNASAVQSWITSASNNLGMLIKLADDTGTGTNKFHFYTREQNLEESDIHAPKLTVNYR